VAFISPDFKCIQRIFNGTLIKHENLFFAARAFGSEGSLMVSWGGRARKRNAGLRGEETGQKTLGHNLLSGRAKRSFIKLVCFVHIK
jgi:hypothetical protein